MPGTPEPAPTVDLPPVEWVSFEDAEGDTWQFDVSFLASRWTCIFGRGCQGVLDEPAAHLGHGCCTHGAHFTGPDDQADLLAAAARLRPSQWQLHAEAGDTPLTTDEDGAVVTKVVDGACVFLNRPGFAGGAGCALHIAALEAGERPLDWKPDVCWQLPLRLEELTDSHGHRVFVLREWKRRDWGEAGLDFHWWCTDAPDAFVGGEPAYVTLRDEIVELVGEEPYRMLVAYLADRTTVMPDGSVPLPHPAVRSRLKQR
jgi:hypothetical protein